MNNKTFIGSFSRSGIACLGVGGGASTNTFGGRIVISGGKLPRATFIKTRGDLSNSCEQAIVPVKIGDLIVEVSGRRPGSIDNPDVQISGYRVVEITTNEGRPEFRCNETGLDGLQMELIPWQALNIYHNRNGYAFVQ